MGVLLTGAAALMTEHGDDSRLDFSRVVLLPSLGFTVTPKASLSPLGLFG
jgi:hypothetical protein